MIRRLAFVIAFLVAVAAPAFGQPASGPWSRVLFTAGPMITAGAGSPEGVVTATTGSVLPPDGRNRGPRPLDKSRDRRDGLVDRRRRGRTLDPYAVRGRTIPTPPRRVPSVGPFSRRTPRPSGRVCFPDPRGPSSDTRGRKQRSPRTEPASRSTREGNGRHDSGVGVPRVDGRRDDARGKSHDLDRAVRRDVDRKSRTAPSCSRTGI